LSYFKISKFNRLYHVTAVTDVTLKFCYTRCQEVEDINWNTIFLKDLSGDVAKYTILICNGLLVSLT
jgi:hypothetical protein